MPREQVLVISSERLQRQTQAVLPEILQFIHYPTSATTTTASSTASSTASTYTAERPDDRAGSIKSRERIRSGSKATYSGLDWLNNLTYIESLTSKHFPSKYSLH